MQISLKSIEPSTDKEFLLGLLQSGFGHCLGEPLFYNSDQVVNWLKQFKVPQIITAQKGLRSYNIGFVGYKSWDIVGRMAELICFAVGPAPIEATIVDENQDALIAALDFGFDELNLNRIVIRVVETNPILDKLEEFGFVAEGLLHQDVVFGNHRLDVTLCSIMSNNRIYVKRPNN